MCLLLLVGPLSVVLLSLFRVGQGMAAGGELVGAYIFTVESAPVGQTCFWSACCESTGVLGMVLGMLSVFVVNQILLMPMFALYATHRHGCSQFDARAAD